MGDKRADIIIYKSAATKHSFKGLTIGFSSGVNYRQNVYTYTYILFSLGVAEKTNNGAPTGILNDRRRHSLTHRDNI